MSVVEAPVADARTDAALHDFLLRTGDNTLILAHRLSEWCGHAPVLEEDIALANTALDLLGQTRLWLELAGKIEGKGRSADDLAYLRDVHEYRNVLLLERPNGDFGKTLMREFLFDAWHHLLLSELTRSADPTVREIAAKAVKEVSYHLDRSTDLVVRLGDGTDESRHRMQEALEDVWSYAGELFVGDAVDEQLDAAGVAPNPASLKPGWDRLIGDVLSRATLAAPSETFVHKGGKRGIHTEHLGHVLAEMQFLQRAYPGASW